jgi:hypothetical protein
MNRFILLLSLFFVSFSLTAMEENIRDLKLSMKNTFANFDTLKPEVLEEMLIVPEQTENYTCGLHQAAHMNICEGGTCENWSFKDNNKFPLSISLVPDSLDWEAIKNQLGNVDPESIKNQLVCGEDGFFRVGPTPLQMECFLNQELKEKNKKAINRDVLTEDDLIKIVRWNLERKSGTLAYHVEDEEKMLMHFYLIVGIAKDNKKLLIMNSKGKGKHRFGKIDTVEFLKSMNASSIVGKVKGINLMGSFIDLRAKINKIGGFVVDDNILDQWKPFSLFVILNNNESIENLQLSLEPKNEGCITF